MKYKRIIAALLTAVTLLSGCSSKEEQPDGNEETLSPKEVIETVFELTEKKDYDAVAGYCRSFSSYSVELYFTDADMEFEQAWTERYSQVLYKLFTSYVSYDNLTETMNMDTRTGSVKGKFTSFDLEKFGEKTDSDINAGLKHDFEAQMDYIEPLIGDDKFKSEPFELEIEFRYTDGEWVISDKSFLMLLTLGYYSNSE